MKKTLTLLVAMIATCALWASNVITYTASKKLTETTGSSYSGLHTDAFDVAITSHTFADSTGTITFSGEVTSIGDKAFYNCSGLTSVAIPNSVTSIGDYAFDGCSGLTAVHISDIAAWCRITFVNYTSNPFLYANHLYVNGSEVTDLVIPNSVTSIGSYTFDGCSSLTSITIPNSVTSIGTSAFYGCSGLTSVAIPNSVTSIGERAFLGCSSLTSITIPNSVTSIGDYAFSGCSGLTSITIPNSVTSIGTSAFNGCSGLTAVHISDIAAWCRITFVNHTSNPFFYANHLYVNGSEVTDLVIPNSVTSIGTGAFSGCSSLTSITIPNSVTSIGGSAFEGCSGLTSITCEAATPPTCESSNWLFYGVSTSIPVYVPCDAVSAYQAAEGWSRFTNIQPIEGTCPPAGQCGDSLYWSIENDTLFITGSGAMFDYNDTNNKAPWRGVTFTSVLLPEGMTSIGSSAFYNCSGLTSITIPENVTSIGSSAFYNCSGLTSITIPNSVTSIGNSAFLECSSLDSVQISDIAAWCGMQFENIYTNPLYYAHHLYLNGTELTDLVIPNTVTSIGKYAFYECSGLTSVTIPNSVTSIGNYAFEYCSSLTSMIVDANNSTYDSRDNCNGIVKTATNTLIAGCKNTIIPNSVTSIGSYAFSGCSGLTSVTIPNSVTSIGRSAFYGCSGLTSITIPNSVTSIGSYAFSDCSSLTSMIVDNGNTKYDSRENCNAIIETATNTLIFGCKQTTIPNSVTSIGEKAFYGCSGLTSVTIPNSVTSIGGSAFYGCSGLTSVTIPNSVTSIGDYAFYDCSGLTSVTIPNSVTSIGRGAFYGCSGLTSVTIPNSVTSIGDFAFYGVHNIVYSGTATGSPWGAKCVNGYVEGYLVYKDATKTNLLGCSTVAIGSIIIPNSVTSIGDAAFYGCSGLTSITIPDSVTTIGRSAFNGCSGLTSITIPESVEHVHPYAFYGCSSLTSVVWNARNIASSDLIINNQIYPIFDIGNPTITSFVLGEGVVNIPSALCYNQPIQSITIPESVELVDFYAFANCSSLTSVTCWASVPPICGNYVFDGVNPSIPLYVPCTSVAAYQTATGWSVFTNIQPIEGSCDAEEITDPVEEVVVEPAVNTVTITWPNVLDADTYVLKISKNGELVCRLTFNSAGQLINIAFAPGRSGNQHALAAQLVTGGWQFTVTSLESGTLYDYALIAKNGQQVVVTHTGSFRTSGVATETTDAMQSGGVIKFLRNDQIFIQRGNRLYDMRGQQVK